MEIYPAQASSRVFSRLVAAHPAGADRTAGDRDLRGRLVAADPGARAALLQEFLGAQVARVLRIPGGKLEEVDAPLTSLGMDSLMGLDLRNRIASALGISMPAALLWTYPTVAAITRWLLDNAFTVQEKIDGGPDTDPSTVTAGAIVDAIRFRPVKAPRVRLFCFHGAGGSPEIFSSWPGRVPNSVEVIGVWHKRHRVSEDASGRRYLEEVTSLLRRHADVPFALCGYSVGGVLAWRAAAELARSSGGPSPVALFAVVPPLSARRVDDLEATDREHLFDQLYGRRVMGYRKATDQIRADAEVDRSLVNATGGFPGETRAPRPSRISTPIIAFGGESDPIAPPDDVERWRKLTSARFHAHFLPGDHLLMLDEARLAEILRLIVSHLDDLLLTPRSEPGAALLPGLGRPSL